jgi:D-glycero-alpha-D-manno-heptose-7-phosphate kinase
MLIISRTPVRISFFGGGTDYPEFYRRHGGAVLGTTIDKFTHVSVSTPGDYFDHKIRVGYSKTELVRELAEIEHPSVRECLRFKPSASNLDIHIFSDLPAKTGLGSSSSFTVGFLHALYALLGQKVSKQRLAEEACHIEQGMIRENVGSQDQFHAAFGGLNTIEFKADKIQIHPVVVTRAKSTFFEQHLMMFYTGLTRHASEILKEQMARTESRHNDAYLLRMGEMVREAEEIFAHEEQDRMVLSLGKLLDEGWKLKKQLSSKITNPLIDQAYDAAKGAGAYGGKLCGAGSGGFLALLVPPEKQQAVRDALPGMMAVPVQFENAGSTIIYMKD